MFITSRGGSGPINDTVRKVDRDVMSLRNQANRRRSGHSGAWRLGRVVILGLILGLIILILGAADRLPSAINAGSDSPQEPLASPPAEEVDLIYTVVADVLPTVVATAELRDLFSGVEAIHGVPDADIRVTPGSVRFLHYSRFGPGRIYSLAEFSGLVGYADQIKAGVVYAIEAARLECDDALVDYKDQVVVCRLAIVIGEACQSAACQADFRVAFERWQRSEYLVSVGFFPTADLQKDETSLDFYAHYGPVLRVTFDIDEGMVTADT